MPDSLPDQFDAPYPLAEKFKRIVIPGILALTILIGLAMGTSSRWLTENIYLQISQSRAESINRALTNKSFTAWEKLQSVKDPKLFFTSKEGIELLSIIRSEVKELNLSHLKIYGRNALLLYSSEEEQIGINDISDGYRKASKGINNLISKKTTDGKQLYELYVKVPEKENIIMELYEPVDYLNSLILQTVVPTTVMPMILLLLIAWIMNRLVKYAQADITYRNDLLQEFRSKLQKLLSQEAVSTVRTSLGAGEVKSKRSTVTILFSDIRGFTSFCENKDPDTIVSFLNQSLGTVIDAVNDQGGDIDKMIGDAVLAFFKGDSAQAKALKAAKQAIKKIHTAGLPRQIGIGIFTGEVVMGTIGASDRMDFTIIGDSVNMASRLCSAARQAEIVVDEESYLLAGNRPTDQTENISVKGFSEPLKIIRLSLKQNTNPLNQR